MLTGLSYKEPDPHNFSFNSPQGFCPKCKGLGVVSQVDVDRVVPDRSLSVYDGALAPLGKYRRSSIFQQIEAVLARYDADLKTPLSELGDEVIDEILYGSPVPLKLNPCIASQAYLLRKAIVASSSAFSSSVSRSTFAAVVRTPVPIFFVIFCFNNFQIFVEDFLI